MSDTNHEEAKFRLQQGLDYLRRHAIDAHRAGDGLQVTHYCSLALTQVEEYGKAHPQHRIELKNVRWAFILGMYWIVHDWFLRLVQSAIEHVNRDGNNATDYELIALIHNRLDSPQSQINLLEAAEIPAEWWSERGAPNGSTAEEDIVAITFVIELVWYSQPSGLDWRDLVDKWLVNSTSDNRIAARIPRLLEQLAYQAGLYSGDAFSDSKASTSLIENDVQSELFQAWLALYNHDHDKFESIHNELKYKVNTDHPSYVALFNLQHNALIHRKTPDSQFVSLPKFQLARSHQPAEFFRHFRESHIDSEFLSIAQAGFPTNSHAGERKTCLRLAMLVSLQALRTWDVGGWISGLRMRARSHLELAATSGDTNSLVAGIIDSVRGHAVLDPKDEPRFGICLQMLDRLSVEQRSKLTLDLLRSPPIEWRQSQGILKYLSDAIPSELHLELAEWSIKVESTNLLKNLWTHTLLDIWDELLHTSPKRAEVTMRLAPILKKITGIPFHWYGLHNTIISAILAAQTTLAEEFIDILLETECNDAHSNQYRFSIGFNILTRRPEIGNRLVSFLKADAAERHDLQQKQVLRQYEMKLVGNDPKKDPAFRREIVDLLLKRIVERADLKGPSIPIGGSNFCELAKLVDWPRPDINLIEKLVAAIDSDTVLYSDKFDYIAFLGELVGVGSLPQAKTIASHALRWLRDGFNGREIGPKGGGPLSNFQVNLGGREELKAPLLYLIKQCSLRCPGVLMDDLLHWLPLHASSYLPKYAFNILETCILLMTAVGKKTPQSAGVLVGLADAIALLATNVKSMELIQAFNQVVLNYRIRAFETAASTKQPWVDTFFRQWAQRMAVFSKHGSAAVRESVAVAVRRWIEAKLPYHELLIEVRVALRNDCRLRVQRAILGDEDLVDS